MASQVEGIKRIPGTPFIVDGFRFPSPLCRHYFLTHAHSDHTVGLNRSFCAGLIYCTRVTAALLGLDYGLPPHLLRPLDLDQSVIIAGVEVTPIDANHCPGACMFLFRVPAVQGGGEPQVILHTGDLRWHPAMAHHPALRGTTLHTLMLDTTYCLSRKVFPPQAEAVSQLVELMRREAAACPATLFVVSSYRIGKERAYLGAAHQLGWRVHCTPAKRKVLRVLGLPPEWLALLAADPSEAPIHVLEGGGQLQEEALAQRIRGTTWQRVVGIRPSGWTSNKSGGMTVRVVGCVTLVGIPYSEHSSYSELRDCVRELRPQKIVPTVNASTPANIRRQVDLLADCMDLSYDRSRLDSYFQRGGSMHSTHNVGAGVRGASPAAAAAAPLPLSPLERLQQRQGAWDGGHLRVGRSPRQRGGGTAGSSPQESRQQPQPQSQPQQHDQEQQGEGAQPSGAQPVTASTPVAASRPLAGLGPAPPSVRHRPPSVVALLAAAILGNRRESGAWRVIPAAATPLVLAAAGEEQGCCEARPAQTVTAVAAVATAARMETAWEAAGGIGVCIAQDAGGEAALSDEQIEVQGGGGGGDCQKRGPGGCSGQPSSQAALPPSCALMPSEGVAAPAAAVAAGGTTCCGAPSAAPPAVEKKRWPAGEEEGSDDLVIDLSQSEDWEEGACGCSMAAPPGSCTSGAGAAATAAVADRESPPLAATLSSCPGSAPGAVERPSSSAADEVEEAAVADVPMAEADAAKCPLLCPHASAGDGDADATAAGEGSPAGQPQQGQEVGEGENGMDAGVEGGVEEVVDLTLIDTAEQERLLAAIAAARSPCGGSRGGGSGRRRSGGGGVQGQLRQASLKRFLGVQRK